MLNLRLSIPIPSQQNSAKLWLKLAITIGLTFSLSGISLSQETSSKEGAAAAGEVDEEFPDAPSVQLTVLESNGKPIPHADVSVSCWFQDQQYRSKYPRDQKADENGIVTIKLLPTLERIRFWVSAEDHVTLFSGFEPGMLANLPSEITFRLQRSESIGGKVLDSDGKPVAGAAIEIMRNGGGSKLDTNDFSQLNTWIALDDDPIRTDEDGEWMIDQRIPTGDDLDLSFIVKHPDLLGDSRWTSMSKKRVTLKQLKERSATFTMTKGARLKGTVVDDAGKPIENALVIWGDRPYWEKGSQEIKTNSDGEFHIPAQSKSKPLNVTVVAQGWMPQLRKFNLAKEGLEANFSMAKGKKLHLKFVDANGDPVPKVRVGLKKWRGIESLYNIQHPNVVDSKIPTVSDENGEYIWDWAPDDEVTYQTGNREFARFTERKLIADGTIQTIELKQKFSLAGTVVNAVTNEPVDQFTITPVTCYPGGRGIAQSNSSQQFASSNFTMNVDSFGHHDGNIKFEIESLGFRVKVTEEFTKEAKPFEGVIAMEPVPSPTGRAVDTAGNPVSGASIFVCTKDNGAMINGIDEYFQSSERMYKAGEDGKFQYAAQNSRVAITIASPDGYAEKYLESDEHPGDVVLKPWARIEGQLVQAGNPVPGATVMVNPIRTLGNENPHVQDIFYTETDNEGRFVFERVPPIPCSIRSRLSPWEDAPITSNRSVAIRLEPGKTHQISLGGEGLQIVGNVKLNGESTDHIEFRYGLNTLLKVGSKIELEKHLVNPGQFSVGQEKDEMMRLTDGSGSTAGYETHFVKINPDGSFLINGVAPGDYRFLLRVYEPPSG